jgi:hypothetical protein
MFRLVFADVAELVAHGLRALGHQVEQSTAPVEGTRAIVLAPHLLRAAGDDEEVKEGDIVYNFEPVESRLFQASLPLLMRRGVSAWDYSRQGAMRLRELGVEGAQWVPVGYAPEMTRIETQSTKIIDVLFYGSMNDRRQQVIAALKARGLRVLHLFGVWGKERDYAIARSTCVLNMHFYPSAPTEDARLFYLLSNRVAIVSEGPPDEPHKRKWALWPSLDELVDVCAAFVALPRHVRETMAEHAFNSFRTHATEQVILAQALERSAPS